MPTQINDLVVTNSGTPGSGSSMPVAQAWTYKVTIGRLEVTQSNPQGLESIVVEDHVDMIGMAEVSFGPELDPWSNVDLGDDVKVEMGEDSPRPIFVGKVTGLRHVRRGGRERLVVIAMDPLARLAASRRTTTFVHASDTDVLRQVAAAAGIQVRRADSGSFSRPYVMQRNESDLDLLRRLATRNGFVLFADEGELVFGAPSFNARPVEVRDADLKDLDWTMSTLQVPKGVDVHTWDPGARQDLEGSAGPNEVVAIGEGTMSVAASWSLWDDIAHLSDVEVTSQALAKAVAIAELNRHSWSFLRGRAVVTGNPLLRADSRVKLLCARERFRPDAWVVGSRHLMEPGRAYTTEIQICSNTRPA